MAQSASGPCLSSRQTPLHRLPTIRQPLQRHHLIRQSRASWRQRSGAQRAAPCHCRFLRMVSRVATGPCSRPGPQHGPQIERWRLPCRLRACALHEQSAAPRQPPGPVLTPLQVELFQVAQRLPQLAQTELLRVVDDMFRAKERMGFRTTRALKAAVDDVQVSPL